MAGNPVSANIISWGTVAGTCPQQVRRRWVISDKIKDRKYSSDVKKYALILAMACTMFSAGFAFGEEAVPAAEEVDEQVRFGVLAKRGRDQCLEQWQPTAEYLTGEIPGYSFSIIPLGFDEIHKAVDSGEVEFVLANSSFYVDLEERYGAMRIATLKNLHIDGAVHKVFAGVIFCRADRQDIRNVYDLENKVFMAVHERSLGGWHMGWRELLEHGIDPYRDFADLRFGGTHDAVVYAVRDGDVDGGTVRSDALERMALEGRIQLDDFRVLVPHENCDGEIHFLHSTRHYPEWPIAKTSHTTDELAEQVAIALIRMPANSRAAETSRCAGWTIPQNYQPVHECLMAIRFTPYEDYGKVTLHDALRQYRFWLIGIFILIVLIVLFIVRTSNLKARLEQSELVRKERDKLTTIFESMKDGVYIVNKDYEIQYVNRALMEEFGPPEGEKCYEYFHNSDEPCAFCKNEDVFAGKTVRWEWTSPKTDKTYDLVDTPMKNSDGSISKLEMFRDITERKKAQEGLERLSVAIDQAAEIVMITDAEGVIQYVNPAFEQITGYSSEEALGQNPRFLKSGEQNGAFYEELWNSLQCGNPWSGRLVNRRKDGTLYTEETTISPVYDASGKTVNYVAVKRDITAEMKLEAQFRQAQKMECMGQLAGGVAHDFNNLLQVILGYGDMALDEVGADTPARASVEEMLNAAHRAKTLVQQLLTFSRQQVLQMKDIDLNCVIGELMKMIQRVIGEHITLDILAGYDLGIVNADSGQIEQILMNLCVNARDAMPDGGSITIETENVRIDGAFCKAHAWAKPGRYALLSITDTGCGMDDETLTNIFEPFFTTKDIGEGTGLGLSTVYGLIKQHQGLVHLYSEVGKGTTFKIYLPLVERSVATVDDKIESPALSGTETILLVEDDKMVRKLSKTILERMGYTVLNASMPSEAIRLAGEYAGEIHLLITDVIMPEMNGLNLTRRLLSIYPRLKYMFISGYTANAITRNGVLDEGVIFLQKPFTKEGLTAKVREALDSE
ncbi:MAG: PhnD/SsuA/transferrin family substrate-binding protein [Candidatus Aegiribacteria sp.]|nr:PhnD/SsuA/transferrin family substrate-binding protein [Candidatus Aegiribacteria sp.]